MDVVHHECVCIGKLIVSHLVNKFSTFNITTIYYHFYKTSLSLIPIVYVHIFLSTVYNKPGVEYRSKGKDFLSTPYIRGGGRSVTSLIFNLGTRGRWVGNFTFRPLYTCERITNTFSVRSCRPQSRSGRLVEEKNFFLPVSSWIQTPDCPARPISVVNSRRILKLVRRIWKNSLFGLGPTSDV